jgi:hypothetical protein
MIRSALAAIVATACVAGTASAAGGSSAWASAELKAMDAAGFGRAVESLTFEGVAASGETGRVTVTVGEAGTYRFVGSCGEDCTDIGLILQKDGATAAEGVTGFKATLQPGAYVLNVGFDNCKEARCRYVVRAYKAG